MKIVEVFDAPSVNPYFSYIHRPMALRRALREAGVQFEDIWLWDYPHKRPAIRRLRNASLIRERLKGADLIIGNQSVGAATAGLAARGLGVPVVFDVHTLWAPEAKAVWKVAPSRRNLVDYLMAAWVEPIARRHANHFLVVSNVARRHYESKGVPPEHITLVRNGIEPELFPFTPLPPEGKRRIVYGGAMQDYQGIPFLTGAFAELVRRKPELPLELYLVGFGRDQAKRREWCESVGEGRILTHGYAPREQFIAELQTAHWGTLAFPPVVTRLRRDAFPYKYAEYIALGRPVVMTDSNETADFCREYRTGIVVPATHEDLMHGYEQAASTPRAEMEAMAERGRHLVETQMTWAHMQSAMYEGLKKLGLDVSPYVGCSS
ncbi:MAG: glycosyltransferase [Fimbriimonadia bacterium]